MNVTFAPLDYAIVGLYVFALVAVGVATARRRKTAAPENEDFLLAGRTLTLPAFVATLVATWYGGILGVGEAAFNYGLGAWTIFALPYYLFAIIYALYLAHRVRGAASLTIPDVLEAAHGRTVALIGAVFVFLLVTPAPYLLMLGVLLKYLFGWGTFPALLLGAALSVGFVVTGGFNNDVRTNILQFLLMFAAFAVLLGFAIARAGNLDALWMKLPETHRTFTGGNNLSYVIVWYFIALWTLVDPGFHQRVSAARDAKTARNGILLSVVCWAVFDFLTISCGMYARVLLPTLTPAVDAYPALSQTVLPSGAKGFFWVGMLATVMSTVLSYTFLAAITLGRDIIWRTGRIRTADDVTWTRLGVLLTTALSIAAALLLPSVIGLWYAFGTAFVPGLLVPLLTAYAPKRLRPAPAFVVAAMLLGTGLPLLWMILAQNAGGMETKYYPLGIEPMYVGLASSALCAMVGQRGQRPKRRAAPGVQSMVLLSIAGEPL